ncbi:L,D-transpeptidase [Pararhodobacter sp.]|uniref:L,D-transpeptidase n=1 Tax=Pararhodobacter sp. TaxID=2127056 RepID=UPI002AFF7BA7|nr:L,D-transpeptidase [Pararhodobacter sp.]
MLSRRHFIISSAALFSAPIALPQRAEAQQSNWDDWDAQVTPAGFDLATSNPWGLHPRFLPQLVESNTRLRTGDIHVDAVARYLYHIRENGLAMRFGVAIGRDGLYEPGTFSVGRKVRWPQWTPTANMIARDPEYAEFAGGMPGGPTNPLGARAFYLYVGSRDTYLRIHGTPQPRTIGQRASSGCVRMVMPHIINLFEDVEIGSMAYLYPASEPITASS